MTQDSNADCFEDAYLYEFSMWTVLLYCVGVPAALLVQALALHHANPGLATSAYNAAIAGLVIGGGLALYPITFIGIRELYQRTPTTVAKLRDDIIDRLTTQKTDP